MRSRDTLLLILVYHIRYTHGATPEAPESYMTIQYPYKDSCFLSSEGLILAAALSSHTWEHHPQDKRADIFVNGLEAGGLDLHAYELNHNNLHLDLGGLPSGVHIVRVDLYNALPGGARGLKIAQETLEIRVGAEHCAYGCTEAGGSQHCPHAPPSTHALLAQELSMLTEKRQRLQQLGCNLALNKRAMQSSVQREGGGGGNAEYAVDGLTSLGQGDAAAPYFAETLEEAEPWWVVDLGADYTICGVGVWVHVILGNATDYPQAVPYSSAGDLRVTLFAADAGSVRSTAGCWECSQHCIHGVCRGGGKGEMAGAEVCVCEADWVGHDCSTNLLADIDYLPSRSFWKNQTHTERVNRMFTPQHTDTERQGGGKGRASQTHTHTHTHTSETEDFVAATEEIRATLHPRNCSRPNSQVNYFPNAGFASVLHFVAGLTNLALAHERTFITSFVRPWVYSLDDPQCATRGRFTCYFEAWSSCAERAAADDDKHSAAASNEPAFYVPETLVEHFHFVPARYRARGVFWWRMVQIEYLMRLTERTKRLLNLARARQDANFTHPIIGLHVRRGDSCHTTLRRNKCIPLSRHLQAVRSMSERYQIFKVFVATDDTSALEYLRSQAGELTFVSVTSYDRSQLQSGDSVWLENRLLGGELSGHELFLFTLIDLALLSEADVIVGHLASNLSRLALLHASFLQGSVPPFISLDGPWCPHWRMCCLLSARYPHSTVC